MKKLELVARNTAETITETELESLIGQAEAGESVRAYVGYEPSGPVHLGTWLSVNKLLDIQDAGMEPVVLLADRHAAKNNKGELDWLQNMAEYWEAVFRALGLTDAEYVLGSEFQDSQSYQSDLEALKSAVTVNRAVRALGDVADDAESATVSQIEYPLMQALDIEHLDIDLAIGGTDQRKIHMLARDELPKLDMVSPTVMHVDLLPALTGVNDKMSTSKPATMFPLHAPADVIRNRVGDAFFDPSLSIEENPVLETARRLIFERGHELHINTEYVDRTYDDINRLHTEVRQWSEEEYSGDKSIHPEDVKTGVAEWLVTELRPVREAVEKQPELLDPIKETND
jgi:tyrosyl-tRNA synthetase